MSETEWAEAAASVLDSTEPGELAVVLVVTAQDADWLHGQADAATPAATKQEVSGYLSPKAIQNWLNTFQLSYIL